MSTKIEWTDETWNPITGCSKISEGCKNCYAERMAKRLARRYGYPKDEPFRPGTVHPDKINNPPKWGGGKKIFVCSMGDLFHKDVPTYKTYGKIFDAAYMSGYGKLMVKRMPDIFIFLTKRPKRMLEVVEYYKQRYGGNMPENCWFGVTAENQEQADKRIPVLLQIPAAVRFVSVEPMLGPVDLGRYYMSTVPGKEMSYPFPYLADEHRTKWIDILDWVICGGESGPGARPMHPDWVRSLRDQCQAAGVPFFFKQWGEWTSDAGWYLKPSGEGKRSDTIDIAPGNYTRSLSVGKVGKKAAGRLLDGREWSELPRD